ncbi:Rne/Rng family ribonuclease [Marinoscillum furvescens]|uniref:Ribonuclease G n=1 Tax=Marinoscillum furvescens DSM 4134 TaxID=1122208 RepID=A0A3D9L2L7_MARFU|nr:Rne/Rng family ribonuclease [Marinoscillum furvescens]RED98958.1 ribonuclease G [Marinoscillum furvescens DSM 4134]
MSNELIINSTQNGCRIALLKNKQLVEFHQEEDGNRFNVGDIYLGSVKKVVQGLNAAFIDIGYEKDAFLHYLDLGPQVQSLNKFTKLALTKGNMSYKLTGFKHEPDIHKLGKINQVLTKNQKILVQVVKEPISTKGPRLSCELSIAGRYLVLVPFSKAVNVSKRISDSNERKRLSRLISSIKPENFGVIIRTVAEGKDVKELDKDLRNLIQIWEDGTSALKKAKPRDKVIGEMNRANSILRDVLNESFDSIVVDDKTLYEEIRSYVNKIAPDKEKILKLYQSRVKIFESYKVEKQLKTSFGKSVSIANGGYLIIEHTEALHVIDVNSGNKSNQEEDQESTALKVNLQAAAEVARQLRLRDMGGIIVVDFIDMRKAENRRKVYDKIKEEMKNDRSKHTVLPLSKFGLLQITRQRVRPELNITTREVCPSCQGTGKITAAISIADQVEKTIDHILSGGSEKKFTVTLHPYLFAYFTKGVFSKRVKWFMKYLKWVNLIEDSSLGLTEYSVLNSRGEMIET